jgi:hypothetical protein
MRALRLAVILVGIAMPVSATVLVPSDLGDLSRGAYAIARGRIVAAEARWAGGERRSIETIVTMAADAWLKGDLGGTVQFRVPGGRLGRYRSVIVGAPSFDAGQQVIVFFGAAPPAMPYVLGLGQGVFRIAAARGGYVVTPPGVLPTAGRAARVVRGDPARKAMPLADFERRVREMAREGAMR